MTKNEIYTKLKFAKENLSTCRGEFNKYYSVRLLLSSVFNQYEMEKLFNTFFHGFYNELDWLYENSESYRNLKDPWSEENTQLIQEWRHQWLDQIIEFHRPK